MFTTPAEFGVADIAPNASYTAVYPTELDLERAAYFFDYSMSGALPDESFSDLQQALARWRDLWKASPHPSLQSRSGPGFVELIEARPSRSPGTYVLTDELAAVHSACQERPVAMRVVATQTGLDIHHVRDVLAALQDRGLVMIEDQSAVTLAVPVRR
jgi:hypothetical protein